MTKPQALARLTQIEADYTAWLAQEAAARVRIDQLVTELLAIREDYVASAAQLRLALQNAREARGLIEGLPAATRDAADWWKKGPPTAASE